MITDKDSIQLSYYCFNVCEVLKMTIRDEKTDDLSESAREALEELKQCVHWP